MKTYINRYGWILECSEHCHGLFRVVVINGKRNELGSGPVETAYGAPWMEESVGRAVYEAELKARPLYHDKTPRKSWDQLRNTEKATWCFVK